MTLEALSTLAMHDIHHASFAKYLKLLFSNTGKLLP